MVVKGKKELSKYVWTMILNLNRMWLSGWHTLTLIQTSGTFTFEYPDGALSMDVNNAFASKDDTGDVEGDEDDGYYGTFNKHIIQVEGER